MNKAQLRALAWCGVLTMVLSTAATAGARAPQPDGFSRFEFALIGDTPYREPDKFENVVDEINDNRRIRFVLHAGDIKTGSSPCSDELFLDRFNRFQRFEAPFVLTPGDNEWTDCHRVAAGEFVPLERLEKLREIFYPVPGQTLGQRPWDVATQADDPLHGEFIENMRWTMRHVVFATVHVVGSNNGLAPFDANSSVPRTAADDAEVERRIAAAVAWIEETYAQATTNEARGVLFLFQANPGFELPPEDDSREGFNEVIAALVDGAKAFGKPVILAHGDSHYFRIDKPVREERVSLPNITRVETFGDADYHWLRVEVDPRSPEVFSVYQEIVEANR